MNWKCPQCGADDNEKSSSRCVCGYEFDEKSPSKVQWVLPSINNQSAITAPSSPKPPKTKKQKLGNVLYMIPIVVLLSTVVVSLATNWNPGRRIIAAIISASVFVSTLSSLLTDEVGICGYGAVNRYEKPRHFWYQFGFQLIVMGAFLLIAIKG